MKLTVNDIGEPSIEFRHQYNSDQLHEKILNVFIEAGIKNGFEIEHVGYEDVSVNPEKNQNIYRIKPKSSD